MGKAPERREEEKEEEEGEEDGDAPPARVVIVATRGEHAPGRGAPPPTATASVNAGGVRGADASPSPPAVGGCMLTGEVRVVWVDAWVGVGPAERRGKGKGGKECHHHHHHSASREEG